MQIKQKRVSKVRLSPQPKLPTTFKQLVRKEIRKYDWNDSVAVAVAMAESGLNANAEGDSSTAYSSWGVFQIRELPGRPEASQLVKYKFNIKYAYNMWKTQGWYPWSCYTNNSYRQYL